MACRLEQIQSDVIGARESLLAPGGSQPQLLRLEEEDSVITFDVQGWGEFTVFLPDVYPGTATVYGPNDMECEHAGAIADIVRSTLADLPGRKARDPVAAECFFDDAAGSDDECIKALDDSADDARSETSSTAISEYFYMPTDQDVEPLLAEHIRSAKGYLGEDAVELTDSADAWRVRLVVGMHAMTGPNVGDRLLADTTAQAWGLDPVLPISIEMRVPKQGYLAATMPTNFITALWQEGGQKFVPEKQLIQILEDFRQRQTSSSLSSKRQRTHGPEESELMEEFYVKKASMISQAQYDVGLGFLVHLAIYAQLRITTLHEYCALCDEPFSSPPMLMRTVCCRELCAYKYCEFGERLTSAAGMNAQAEIIELLVCMLAHACRSHRKELVLDPYPCVYDDAQQVIFHPANKDYKKIQGTIDELMLLRKEVASAAGAAWTMCRPKLSTAGNGLIQWVIASNRTLLVPLADEHRIGALGTEFQYLLISAPPEKEQRFQALKKQHGSFFAFHGSHVGNWHSILRNGLKNASNTPLMSAGASYGPGIYLGRSSSISAGYSHHHPQRGVTTTPKQKQLPLRPTGTRIIQYNERMAMMALCEVVDHPSVKRFDWGFVAPDEDTVCTRFFFLYDVGEFRDVQLTAHVVGEIHACMADVKMGPSTK